MNKNLIHIMHMEYNNTVYNCMRYPLAMLIKLGAHIKYPNASISVKGAKKKVLPSHSGIIINIDNQFILLEFLGKGMAMIPLNEKIEQHKKFGTIYIEELKVKISDNFINKIIFKNIKYLDKKKYDVLSAILSFTNSTFINIKYKTKGTFCSAFVTSLLYDEGISLQNNDGISYKEEPVDLLYSLKIKNGEKVSSVFYI